VAFIERNGKMVAAAALKKASADRAKDLTWQSKYQLSGDIRELGYVVVSCGWRGLRLSGKVVREILAGVGDEELFATTSDAKMKCTLAQIGFRWVGREWPSAERPGELLSLWIRKLSQTQTKDGS
jgi:predicted GNAT family N-acyltransferase